MTAEIEARSGSGHRGPHPGALGITYTALFAASLVTTIVMSHGTQFPTPFDAAEVAQRFFVEHASALRIGALLQFGSAIPLGIFTATVVSRLQYLGMNVAGIFIALFGGFAASFFVALSALAQWALTQPGVAGNLGTMEALRLLAFATGGPGYVVPLGLLLAGVSIPSMFGRLLPRWLIWTGLIVAGLSELSVFSLVIPQAAYFLPLGRFPAFIWLIAVGFSLPRSRAEARKNREPIGPEGREGS